MLQQIKQPHLLYKQTHRDRGRKTIHSNSANNVVQSYRRLGRAEEHSNTSVVEKEDSVWISRNHARFFRDRKLLVDNQTSFPRYFMQLPQNSTSIVSHTSISVDI